ncbi:peptidoglycan recognition family protein [Tissierella sp.]|uniref:peptidoglycan recognition protein family protein n=1 Tax=Tissierella sp. TaxID=41274 RepID=UPI002864DD13|nr:peptidoglycan recognition family protein [Tissierella sp.]MDR7856075.1 peptidoglycan recognition family protein [Tissierella sp.]
MAKEYEIITSLLSPNIYSRPQSKMLGIKGIGIHWVGNANSKAINNRNYFENLKNQTATPKRYASSHEVIGLDGEVIICLPKTEVAYHVGAKSYKARAKQLLANSPNRYLYGIEACHPDWSGKFNDKTYNTLINRVADLLIEFDLRPSKDTLWRHFDVTGKDCPKYYMVNPSAWDKLVADITKRYYAKVEVLVVAELLEWQKVQGEKALDSLNKKKDNNGNLIVNSPDDWKKKLGENIPGWLFWSIIDRISK